MPPSHSSAALQPEPSSRLGVMPHVYNAHCATLCLSDAAADEMQQWRWLICAYSAPSVALAPFALSSLFKSLCQTAADLFHALHEYHQRQAGWSNCNSMRCRKGGCGPSELSTPLCQVDGQRDVRRQRDKDNDGNPGFQRIGDVAARQHDIDDLQISHGKSTLIDDALATSHGRRPLRLATARKWRCNSTCGPMANTTVLRIF